MVAPRTATKAGVEARPAIAGRRRAGAGPVGLVVATRNEVGPTMAGLATVVRVDEATEAAKDLAQVDVATRRRAMGKIVPLVLVLDLTKAAATEVRLPGVVEVEEEVDVAIGQDAPSARPTRHVVTRPVLAAGRAADPTETEASGLLAHAEAGVHRPVAAVEVAVGRLPRGVAPEVGAIVANPDLHSFCR